MAHQHPEGDQFQGDPWHIEAAGARPTSASLQPVEAPRERELRLGVTIPLDNKWIYQWDNKNPLVNAWLIDDGYQWINH